MTLKSFYNWLKGLDWGKCLMDYFMYAGIGCVIFTMILPVAVIVFPFYVLGKGFCWLGKTLELDRT